MLLLYASLMLLLLSSTVSLLLLVVHLLGVVVVAGVPVVAARLWMMVLLMSSFVFLLLLRRSSQTALYATHGKSARASIQTAGRYTPHGCASDVDNTALKLLPVIPHAPKDPKNIVLPRHCQQTQCDYGMGGVTNKSSSTGPHAVAWHTPRAVRRPDAVPGCKTFPYRDIATKRHATITIPFEARWSG